jgi:mono/diheme cytochrome c family protein
MVIPGVVVGLLLLLPFLDRRPDRHFVKRPRVIASFGVIGLGIVVLTYLGLKDTPAHADPGNWGPLPVAGQVFVQDKRCQTCHAEGGTAGVFEEIRIRRDPEWIIAHARDPEIINPGTREAPQGGMSEGQARSVLSYMEKVRVGAPAPQVSEQTRTVAKVLGTYCANCHMIDGEGASSAPDLSRVGASRDREWLHQWITSPEDVDPFASMPAFGEALSAEEMKTLVDYLARRK